MTDLLPAGPTTDLATAELRFIALIDANFHRSVPARKGRWLAWNAVYGDLWHPDRVGRVPADLRPVLLALVRHLNAAVFPGGAYAGPVSAEGARAALVAAHPLTPPA
jgi:hypothetical protein